MLIYRRLALSTILLMMVCGIATGFATNVVHDPGSSKGLLFAAAWASSAAGLLVAVFVLCYNISGDQFGTSGFPRELFTNAIGFGVIVALAGAAVAGGVGASKSGQPYHYYRFACSYLGVLAGYGVGFFALVVMNAKESWVGGVDVPRATPLRRVG